MGESCPIISIANTAITANGISITKYGNVQGIAKPTKPNAKNPITIHCKVLVFIIKEVFYTPAVQPPTVIKQNNIDITKISNLMPK